MNGDPVCGMLVDEPSSLLKFEYLGKTYYFRSPGCKKSSRDDHGRSGRVPSHDPWRRFKSARIPTTTRRPVFH